MACLTQQLTSVAKPFRENVARIVTFYNPSKNDMQQIENDYLYGTSKEELKRINSEFKTPRCSHLHGYRLTPSLRI